MMGVKSKMKKFALALIFISLLMLPLLVPGALAAGNFTFTDLEVEGTDLLGTSTIVHVERGDRLDIRVELKATSDVEDLKIKAWIGGYEFGDIEDETEMFDLDSGTTTSKHLTLKIPEDILASRGYTLHIDAFDRENRVTNSFPLDLEERRRFVNLFRVFFTPGLTVKSGDFLSIGTLVENFGGFKSGEKNVIVEASIPQLGITVADSIDELATETQNEKDSDRDDTAKIDLPPISLNGVKPGIYDLKVRVLYNRAKTATEENYKLTVTGDEITPSVIQQNLIVNVDSGSKELGRGKATAYTIMLGNLGDKARTFTAEVLGTQTFAKTRVEPAIVAVQPGSTNQITLFLVPNDDAEAGKHLFTVRIKEDATAVKELNLEGNVVQLSTAKPAGTLENVKQGLQIGFIVLLIILVILGIVIAATKARRKKTEEAGETQTYY